MAHGVWNDRYKLLHLTSSYFQLLIVLQTSYTSYFQLFLHSFSYFQLFIACNVVFFVCRRAREACAGGLEPWICSGRWGSHTPNLDQKMMVFHWFLSVWRLTPINLFACYFAENVPRLQPEHILPILKALKNIKNSSNMIRSHQKLMVSRWFYNLTPIDLFACQFVVFCVKRAQAKTRFAYSNLAFSSNRLRANPTQTAARTRFGRI